MIVAEDRSVWIMGISTMDRATFTQPLQVETDYVTEETDLSHYKHPSPPYFFLSPSDKLCKGHNRMTLHLNKRYKRVPEENQPISNECYQSFEIILSQGEAYLIPLKLDFSTLNLGIDPTSKQVPRVIDYSTGWKHELLVLESQSN